MPEEFGEYLRALRLKTGMGLNELAKAVPIAASTLSDYELGKRTPPDSVLKALSRLLDVSYEDLKHKLYESEVTELLRADPYLSEQSKRSLLDFYHLARQRDREETERRRRGE